jgi:hypothetical protein
MQTLTKMDRVVIGEIQYDHTTIMGEDINRMKLANLLSPIVQTIAPPLLYIYLRFKILIAFLNVH